MNRSVDAPRALLSVSDKQGLAAFARGLADRGWELVSTGGTQRALQEAGLDVRAVSDITGFPEILGGRVKTLHPAIHAGILADRDDAGHRTTLAAQDLKPIDLVAVNLYPFRETIRRPGVRREEAIENIDIGGPCMLRAAAKNHRHVTVAVDPADYPRVLAALDGDADLEALRRELAVKAFAHTHAYDGAIAGWLAAQEEPATAADGFPESLEMALERVLLPRYGENPHQAAAVYRERDGAGLLGGMESLQGKELSWNNLLDADAARKLAGALPAPAVVIVKHNNPCGVGLGTTVVEAYERALACDPVSAFGSILAVRGAVDASLASQMADLFVEVLIAAEITPEARQQLAGRSNLRVLLTPDYAPERAPRELRAIDGGFLAQMADCDGDEPASWTCVTRRRPEAAEREAAQLAWAVARSVKSNAIVIANPGQTVGIGAGQMSRVDSCELAVRKAVLPVAGCAAASDAFFPFRDGLDVLARAGVTTIVQPGGSKRDPEVIAAADEQGLAMLFTGRRHFRH